MLLNTLSSRFSGSCTHVPKSDFPLLVPMCIFSKDLSLQSVPLHLGAWLSNSCNPPIRWGTASEWFLIFSLYILTPFSVYQNTPITIITSASGFNLIFFAFIFSRFLEGGTCRSLVGNEVFIWEEGFISIRILLSTCGVCSIYVEFCFHATSLNSLAPLLLLLYPVFSSLLSNTDEYLSILGIHHSSVTR